MKRIEKSVKKCQLHADLNLKNDASWGKITMKIL